MRMFCLNKKYVLYQHMPLRQLSQLEVCMRGQLEPPPRSSLKSRHLLPTSVCHPFEVRFPPVREACDIIQPTASVHRGDKGLNGYATFVRCTKNCPWSRARLFDPQKLAERPEMAKTNVVMLNVDNGDHNNVSMSCCPPFSNNGTNGATASSVYLSPKQVRRPRHRWVVRTNFRSVTKAIGAMLQAGRPSKEVGRLLCWVSRST